MAAAVAVMSATPSFVERLETATGTETETEKKAEIHPRIVRTTIAAAPLSLSSPSLPLPHSLDN